MTNWIEECRQYPTQDDANAAYLQVRALLQIQRDSAVGFLKGCGIELDGEVYKKYDHYLDTNEVSKAIDERLCYPIKYFYERYFPEFKDKILPKIKNEVHHGYSSHSELEKYVAVFIIKTADNANKYLDSIRQGHNNDTNFLRLSLMMSKIATASAILTTQDVEKTHRSKKQSDSKRAGDRARRDKVQEIAKKLTASGNFVWDTPEKQGKLKKTALAREINKELGLSERTILNNLPDRIEELCRPHVDGSFLP